MVYDYNQSVHRSIKVQPTHEKNESDGRLWHILYDIDIDDLQPVNHKFIGDDQVRITKFLKGNI